MGSTNFGTIKIGKFKDYREAYNGAVQDALHEYGHDAYNGTISTTDGVRRPNGHPKFGTKTFSKWESKQLEKMNKWGTCLAVEIKSSKLKELKEQYGYKCKKGVKAYYFFGWAAE